MGKGKTAFMPEAEIQALESELASDKLNMEDLAQNPELARMFVRLLRSYRLAACVANQAWALVESMGVEHPVSVETNARMRALCIALHDYAPEYFPRVAVAPQTMSALQEMYNELSERPDVPPSFLDYFFETITGLQG